MSESLEHVSLVAMLVDWVRSNHATTQGLCIFCDSPTVFASEKPPAVEGFFPDVCAISTPPKVTILGEAKTLPDLESRRSSLQFLAFLRFLAVRPGPVLIIAIPWKASATAKCIIAAVKREALAEHVPVYFLTGS